MRTLNKAELIQKFLDLKTRPHAENGFNAVTISDDSTHRLGISPEGYPIFFIDCSTSVTYPTLTQMLVLMVFFRLSS